MTEPTKPQQHALALFQQAYELQMKGELEQAIAMYSRSIAVYPTAEAYTFRGWSYAFKGDYNAAIEECLKAIEIDADYGNPYNDIGAYLIELARPGEAIEWLERALAATRYDSYCFAHFNLGRAYEALHDYPRALGCYRDSLNVDPSYKLAKEALARLRSQWN